MTHHSTVALPGNPDMSQYILHPFMFFPFFCGYNLVSILRSRPTQALLNLNFEHSTLHRVAVATHAHRFMSYMHTCTYSLMTGQDMRE
jgi:hypothetical protein